MSGRTVLRAAGRATRFIAIAVALPMLGIVFVGVAMVGLGMLAGWAQLVALILVVLGTLWGTAFCASLAVESGQ